MRKLTAIIAALGYLGTTTRHGSPTHVLADRRLADPRRLADKPPAHPQRVRQTQHVTYLPHRHSLRRHRSPPGCQGDRSADSTVDGSALYAAITCCPQSPECGPPCAGIAVRVAPDSAATAPISMTRSVRGAFTSVEFYTAKSPRISLLHSQPSSSSSSILEPLRRWASSAANPARARRRGDRIVADVA